MEDKSLADRAVSIKGKQYVLVQDRVLYFNDKYEHGAIETELVSKPEDGRVIVKATVWPEGQTELRHFTGYSQAVIGQGMVNQTAALENAETSAVGRALAFMGIGVIESIASADEMRKAAAPPQNAPKQAPVASKAPWVKNDHTVKIKAAKDRVLKQLDMLKLPHATKEECEASVLANTGLPLIESKLDEIGDRLALILEENNTK